MAEFQTFTPGTDFLNAYNNANGNRLAKLAFQSQGDTRKNALGELYGINPERAQTMSNEFNEQDKADLAEFSRIIINVPDDMKAQMYERGKAKFAAKIQSLGGQIPATVQEAMPFFQQLAGAEQSKNRVHSQYMGKDGNIRVVMSDGTEKTMGAYNPKYKPHYDALGNVTGYDERTNTQSTTMENTGNNDPNKGDFFNYNPAEQEAITRVGNGMGEQVRLPDGRVMSNADYQRSQQPARVGVKPVAPASAPSGYRFQPDGSLLPIKGGPADPLVTKPSKPWTPAGLAKYNEVRTDAQVATTLNTMMDDMANLFNDSQFDLGPVQNKIYEAQNWAGKSTPQSQAYAKLKSNFEKMRNDSLRLNKGVQTDGDAQRAWNEILQNMNDKELVKARLTDIKRYNEFALNEKRLQVENFESQFGNPRGSQQQQAPTNGMKNAKGWTLHTDANGNKAYVSPDGKQFEEAN